MENGDLADSIKDSALYAEYSWSLKEGLNTNPLTWKTVETQQKRMTILEQYNSNEIAASYDQIKNIPKEVLNNKNILYSSKNIDDNSKISCFTFNGGNAGDITNLEKDYSEEESDDNTDEEDEIDDEDSCESCDDDTRSSKTSNNLFSYDYNELQHKDKHVDSSELYSETTDNKTEKNVVDCTDRLDMRFIEKKKERKNKQGIDWKPKKERSTNWLTEQMYSGTNARKLLTKILPYSRPTIISPHCSDSLIWKIIANACSEPPRRRRLSSVNTFNDVIKLIEKSSNIIVLTGAGVSVSCGIPDFRSSDGIYSRLAKDFPDLPDPQAMFDINYFSRDPRPFYRFAREIYPGQFKPSPCHRFIKLLEDKNKLLRNYTQNIDTLEQAAGIKNVIECHGSFSTASCTKCKYKCSAENIRTAIFEQRIPVCPQCQSNVEQSVKTSQILSEEGLSNLVKNGIMKPDIVFFGEGLSDEFHTVMANDKNECDLLIVIGSSLKVRPVALIPSSIPAHVPQILINREKLHHLDFDVKLLGDGDIIINQICQHLGGDFKDICFSDDVLRETTNLVPNLAMDGIGEEVCENADKEKGLRTNYIKCKHLADTHCIQSPLSLRRNILPSTSKINNDNSVNQSPEELKSSNCNHCSANRDNKLQQQWQQNKKISERLIDGTYYWHEQSASCVFPGAQVTTCSDTETDDDELFGEIPSLSMVEETATTCTSRQQYGMDIASLSPIMTPSVEAEMVNDIESSKTVSQTAVNDKNDVNDSTYQFNLQSSTSPNSSNPTIIMDNAIINAQVSNLNIINNITTKNRIPILTSISAMEEFHNPPPYKKPRDSWEATDAADIDETKLNVTNYVTQLPPSSNANVNLL